mgnify:CR=1 FL=1
MFHLNLNSSYLPDKILNRQTDGQTDGQSGDYMLPPLWNIIMNVSVAILSPLYQFTTVTQYIKYSMAGLHVLSDGRIVRQTDIIFS